MWKKAALFGWIWAAASSVGMGILYQSNRSEIPHIRSTSESSLTLASAHETISQEVKEMDLQSEFDLYQQCLANGDPIGAASYALELHKKAPNSLTAFLCLTGCADIRCSTCASTRVCQHREGTTGACCEEGMRCCDELVKRYANNWDSPRWMPYVSLRHAALLVDRAHTQHESHREELLSSAIREAGSVIQKSETEKDDSVLHVMAFKARVLIAECYAMRDDHEQTEKIMAWLEDETPDELREWTSGEHTRIHRILYDN